MFDPRKGLAVLPAALAVVVAAWGCDSGGQENGSEAESDGGSEGFPREIGGDGDDVEATDRGKGDATADAGADMGPRDIGECPKTYDGFHCTAGNAGLKCAVDVVCCGKVSFRTNCECPGYPWGECNPMPGVCGPCDGGSDAGEDGSFDSGGVVDAGFDGGMASQWEIAVVDDQPGFKSRAASTLCACDAIHVAYNVATSPDGWDTPAVWYGNFVGGPFKKALAASAAGVSNEFPVIVVDKSNTAHIFYNRFDSARDQVDLMYVTVGGDLKPSIPVNITDTADRDEYAANAVVGADGTIHLLFQERKPRANPGEFDYSVGYLSITGGAPSAIDVLAAETAPFSLSPDFDLVVTATWEVHAVYCKPGSQDLNNVLYYRKKTASGWEAEEQLSGIAQDVWSPALALDGAGVVHLAYTEGADWDHKTLTYNRLEADVWQGAQAISTSIDDRTYYLGVAGDPAAGVHIAFKRFFDSMSDILYIRGNDGVFETEELVTATPDMDEDTPSLTVTSTGLPQIVFTENLRAAPNGTIYVATRKR